MNIYFHKIIFCCFFLLFVGQINAEVVLPSQDICKVIKGQLTDYRTKNYADEVEISLKSMVTGKIYTTETDEKGNFYFYKIPIGKCSLSLKVSWMFNWGDRTIILKSGKKYVQEHYWSHLLAKIVLGIYTACLILIFYYSCIQMTLAIAYVRNRKKRKLEEIPLFDSKNAPKVTIQLPMYNE
ncbi:MAG: carboxypeptidase regulatory-like domain-containing protein, partial [Crocinitomicaceae bacterium]|nr:carboxypeptidase regulatory-like domain-containing protein [Crocinitomicaceae bacterium]